MSDPFDVFDPFQPLAAEDDAGSGAPEDSDEPAASDTGPDAPGAAADAAPDAVPDTKTPTPKAARRWSAPRGSAVPERAAPRPSPSEPVAESAPEGRSEAAARPEQSAPAEPVAPAQPVAPAELAPPAQPSAPAESTAPAGTAALRAIALPEIRKAVARLSDRGHLADLDNRLAEEDDPRLVMRFRPDSGPLGRFSLEPRHVWRFELRLAVEEDRTGDDRVQALAGYIAGNVDTRFAALGRIPVRSLTPEWVSERIVEFLERNLGGS